MVAASHRQRHRDRIRRAREEAGFTLVRTGKLLERTAELAKAMRHSAAVVCLTDELNLDAFLGHVLLEPSRLL